MQAHVRANMWLLVFTVLLCCILYPLSLWAVGQSVFADKASGSLIYKDGAAVGSRLIAQPFHGAEYFWPRPSAVGYDASASGGSNYSASNPKLRARVALWLQEHPEAKPTEVPADMVMASGSGLDPHITLKNARYQLDRVVDAWAEKKKVDKAEVRKAIEILLIQKAEAPLGGLAGVDLLNVLEVNLALPDVMKGLQRRVAGEGDLASGEGFER